MLRCDSCGADLPAGARFCPICAAPVERGPGGHERKVATALFADLVGSTQLASDQDPERIRGLLDRFYDSMSAEIARTGGTLEKFVGDAVMAAFGAPLAQEDHAERALHAALSMRGRLKELFGEALALRIGVNSGEVVVGRPREGSSFITGDAVNVAARLEQAAAPGQILVGERTAAAAGDAFEFEDPVTVEAKGKPGGVPCRPLLRALSLARPRGVRGLPQAFVGRESELDLLRAAYLDAVTEHSPRLITAVGDAGVGKSRLAAEAWTWLAGASPRPALTSGRCLPYGRSITYLPLAEMLRQHLSLQQTDPPERVLERLGGREILGLILGLDVSRDLHPLVVRERLRNEWVRFLEEQAALRPLVMLVEDVHWAEEALLELLDDILVRVRGPVLLLATARPEFLARRPEWKGAHPSAQLLRLSPLSSEETTLLVERLLGTGPTTSLRAVLARTEGNPFFVEEVLSALIDHGILRQEGGGWTCDPLPQDLQIPDSVQAVVASRIDLLDPEDKAALQAASVIGRTFWERPVLDLLSRPEARLDILEDREFVRAQAASSLEGEREFAFKHAITRDVGYGMLPRGRRANLHAQFAGWIEGTGRARDELAPVLGHHYAEAVRSEVLDLAWAGREDEVERLRQRAVWWLRRAADLAVRRYDIEGALAALHKALETEPDQPSRAALWLAIGRANALWYDGQEFWATMEKAIALAVDTSQRVDAYAELAFQTVTRSGMWRRSPDTELVEGWIQKALDLTEPLSAARAKALIARSYWLLNAERAGQSGADGAEAEAIGEAIGDLDLRVWGMGARMAAVTAAGNLEEAAGLATRRLALLSEAGEASDPDHLAEAYFQATYLASALGRMEEAMRLAEIEREITSGLSPHHRTHGIGHALWVEFLCGRWEAVADLTPETEEAVAANRATPCATNPMSLFYCAVAQATLGNFEESVRLEKAADDLGMQGYDVDFNPQRVRLALARRDLERVRELLPTIPRDAYDWGSIGPLAARLDALAAVDAREEVEAEAPRLMRPGTYVEPFAMRALGMVRGDGSLIEDAAKRFDSYGLAWHAGKTRALLADADRLPPTRTA